MKRTLLLVLAFYPISFQNFAQNQPASPADTELSQAEASESIRNQLKQEEPMTNLNEVSNTDTLVYKLVNELGEVLDFVDSKQLTEYKVLKVIAGDGFRIRSMKVILARDSNIVADIETASGLLPPTIYAICQPGDRLIITVKKVTKLLPNGKEKNVNPGNVNLRVDIR